AIYSWLCRPLSRTSRSSLCRSHAGRVTRASFAVDGPAQAELIDNRPKARGPECFLEGHRCREGLFRELLEYAVSRDRIVHLKKDLEALRLVIPIAGIVAARNRGAADRQSRVIDLRVPVGAHFT